MTSAVLRGRRLTIIQVAWGTVTLLAVALFLAGLPTVYEELRALSMYGVEDRNSLRANLAQAGLSVDFYAAYILALGVIFTVACFALATVIFLRRSDELMALFVALLLVLLGATLWVTTDAAATIHPILGWLSGAMANLGLGSLFLFFYLFPDGRFVPRWTFWLAVALGVVVVSIAVLPGQLSNIEGWPPLAFVVFLLGWLLTGVYAQFYRYRHVSGSVQRQQTKWVVFAFAVAPTGWAIVITLLAAIPSLGPGSAAADLVGATVTIGFVLLIPLSLGVAILRHRLWDIDIIINRTIVYSLLTAIVVGIYALVVASLAALLQVPGNFTISLPAAGLVAVLFQPLRIGLQRAVNRLMYGERDDPYKVLSRLGRRLGTTLEPQAVLPTIVETVAGALKLPYVAIAIEQEEGLETAAAHGYPTGEQTILPLAYQGETIGQLILAPRAPGEQFSPADRRLLEDLAHNAEVAVHAVRLTADLQRSRERLVTTREEERRRLRRDLHDGLGPMLAGLTFGLDAARNLLTRKPEDADAVLVQLKSQTQDAVSGVRRLVYGLRPPALDDLGLIPAIQEQASRHGRLAHDIAGGKEVKADHGNGLIFSVEAPKQLPPLPAAVEVACYRIAQEAMTNVARHARARFCHVRLSLDEAGNALELEVTDDGAGLAKDRRAGVGTASMRERASELGGTCAIVPAPEGGTRVLARLPLPEKEDE